uniref:Uncharacterized protein n=1 Tax=Medicago truncatula TaxID=3880 RepID=A2Q4U6_MEDTR|nr:hypothetical protein MtrDRAFT_AC157891g19v2 [Medicago truncatula]
MLEGLVSAVARRGYLVYEKKKKEQRKYGKTTKRWYECTDVRVGNRPGQTRL